MNANPLKPSPPATIAEAYERDGDPLAFPPAIAAEPLSGSLTLLAAWQQLPRSLRRGAPDEALEAARRSLRRPGAALVNGGAP
ncbi:hypothetical protein Mal64_34650 [Pseudobythopirellula maris]|uniref:Uncharacterized protein n=1 Tax=Pseudobythopirellula maris TaxID=2527991 RepID=A0A5C5ZHF1_9BACT|nr:hypothetical protein [Pseudobythopirellula maris]TWT86636.1 hypothetical protein Mal64_34650 [Pseudobythopirellula maris]